jgi:hypothetical protein
LAVQSALLGEVTRSLRAVVVDHYTDTSISIVAYFDARAGEDEHEALNRAETQLIARFPEAHTISVSSVELPEPLPIPRQGLWAYCRWEASRG